LLCHVSCVYIASRRAMSCSRNSFRVVISLRLAYCSVSSVLPFPCFVLSYASFPHRIIVLVLLFLLCFRHQPFLIILGMQTTYVVISCSFFLTVCLILCNPPHHHFDPCPFLRPLLPQSEFLCFYLLRISTNPLQIPLNILLLLYVVSCGLVFRVWWDMNISRPKRQAWSHGPTEDRGQVLPRISEGWIHVWEFALLLDFTSSPGRKNDCYVLETPFLILILIRHGLPSTAQFPVKPEAQITLNFRSDLPVIGICVTIIIPFYGQSSIFPTSYLDPDAKKFRITSPPKKCHHKTTK